MNTSSTPGSRITQCRNSNSRFFRELGNRSPADAGFNKSRWGEFARDQLTTFSGDEFHGIALAFDRPGHIVGRVALASMGLTADTTSGGTLEGAVRAEYQFTEHDGRILRAARTESTYEDDTEGHEQEPRTDARGAEPPQPPSITRAGKSSATQPASDSATVDDDDDLPMLHEWALPAECAPSEGRGQRVAQDEAAEEPQDNGEWGLM